MKNRLSVAVALLMVFGPFASPARAEERSRQSTGRFVSNGINQVALQVADGTNVGQAILVRSQAIGTSGKSQTEALMQWDLDAVTFSPDCFEGGFGLVFPIVQYDYQTTYSDLSSTHGSLVEGELCVNYYDVSQTRFRFDVKVVGGTGRFAGATGVTRFQGKSQALPPGRFSVSEGVYETTLTWP